ncbi:MAG TPA: sulfatase [bacterium]|nr:sulfatase [bacterium]
MLDPPGVAHNVPAVAFLLNPPLLALALDLILGRPAAFNLEQKLFYLLSLAGSVALWLFVGWLLRAPSTRPRHVAAAVVAALYAINLVLVYGYRLTVGAMPNYYTFEYLFAEPYNSWTILRDSWAWSHTLALPIVFTLIWIGLSRWRAFLGARCQVRRHRVIAAANAALAVIILLVIHNNIRFVDQCYTADLTTSASVLRNVYTRLSDPNAGRSGLSARVPMDLPPLAHEPRTSVLIILTESLRADALGCYGYTRPTTPFLDSLVDNFRGLTVRYDNAYATATMTYIAVPTLLTGVSPLSPALALHTQPTFWEYQKALGRRTFFFTSQSQEWENIRAYFTIPAIDYYYNKEIAGIGARNDLGIDDHYVVDHFIDWLGGLHSRTPFAGVIQLNQTHYPYWTPDSLRPFGAENRRDLYDNAVRYTDDQLRRIIHALAFYGHLDGTLIIITSDHGEAFYEHEIFGHLNCLYREGIRVPLLVLFPWYNAAEMPHARFRRLRDSAPRNVSNLDILPTLLDIENLWGRDSLRHITDGMAGRSLMDSIPPDRIIVTSNLTEMTRRHLGLSLIIDHWHYILNLQGEKLGVEELYDWSADPGETTNVIDRIPADLRQRITEFMQAHPVSQRALTSLTDR